MAKLSVIRTGIHPSLVWFVSWVKDFVSWAKDFVPGTESSVEVDKFVPWVERIHSLVKDFVSWAKDFVPGMEKFVEAEKFV